MTSPRAAAEWARGIRSKQGTVGFIPTMGALHVGHLELVRKSVAENDATCVSVFVNPLQFDSTADFEDYRRDLKQDAELLETTGCDVVFTGELTDFFPEMKGDPTDSDLIESVDPGIRGVGLEGEHRSGHFEGVATIVKRLFQLIEPNRAYFGEKDFQQTLVVKELSRALGFPDIIVVPTYREPSGLAYSSRNERLTESERGVATSLSRGLFAAREAWAEGERDADQLLSKINDELDSPLLEVEYVELRDPLRWELGALSGQLQTARALVAARVGDVRLIDNLALHSVQ
ncbi:MAG: pantoate--beta-alanine ligase [Planctomycetota bacterium]|jgi:pantoate--beta-alanine ligase